MFALPQNTCKLLLYNQQEEKERRKKKEKKERKKKKRNWTEIKGVESNLNCFQKGFILKCVCSKGEGERSERQKERSERKREISERERKKK